MSEVKQISMVREIRRETWVFSVKIVRGRENRGEEHSR